MSALFNTDDPIADAYIDAALQTAGIGVLAFMLSEYENHEEYEECAIICKAIAAMSGHMEKKPAGGFVWGEPMKEWIRDVIWEICGTDGDIAMSGMPHYADMVESIVNKVR